MGIMVRLSLGLLYGTTSVIVYTKLLARIYYSILMIVIALFFSSFFHFLLFGTAIKCEILHDLKSSNTCNLLVF